MVATQEKYSAFPGAAVGRVHPPPQKVFTNESKRTPHVCNLTPKGSVSQAHLSPCRKFGAVSRGHP